MKQITEEQALSRLEALCAKAEKCSADADAKMRQWGLAAHERQRVIDKLVEGRYIDDERFARAFVRDKVAFQLWGPVKVEYALRAKRVPQEAIDQAMEEISADQWADAAQRALTAKVRDLAASGDPTWRAKAARHAMQRGFGYDMLRTVMASVASQADDDSDELAHYSCAPDE